MDYEKVIYAVAGNLLIAVAVIAAYGYGKHIGKEYSSWLKKLGMGIGPILFLSIVCMANYGTHTEDSDPIYGGGNEVVDFVPTRIERNNHGAKIFLTLVIPGMIGLFGKRSI